MDEPKARRNGGRQQAQLPRYDQALLAAKNAKKQVRFTMAMAASFTDDEGEVIGHVLEVDRFNVKIQSLEGRTPWLAKPMIVGTEVLDG